MQSDPFAVRTSPELLAKIRSSPIKKSTSSELLEQRVSFVFGSMAKDSGVTRERVRQVILEQVGETVGAVG